MKKVLSILMVALAMTAMVACGDEKDNEGDNNVMELADNTLVYDGVTYHMDAFQSYYHAGLTTVDAVSLETDGGEPVIQFIRLHIRPTMWNRTADVFTETNEDETWECGFTGTIFDGEYFDIYDGFSACKIGVFGDNNGTPVTVTLDGTLKNGKTMQMKLVTPSQVD